MVHFNALTPGELERLSILTEELGESVQAIGKILRHGYTSVNPDRPDKDNRSDLEAELGDVRAAEFMMFSSGDISPSKLERFRKKKLYKKNRYLHHQDSKIAYNPKRVVISGSRSFTDYERFCRVLNGYLDIIGRDNLVFISGHASRGPDEMIIRFCMENDYPFETFPADWENEGKKAGYLRNLVMRDRSSHLLAFWDTVSRGTKHMVDACLEVPEIQTFVVMVDPPTNPE